MAWFQPPQLRIGDGIEQESRHATWLELFYDLVFVVAVAQLAHALYDHVSVPGVLGFLALFIPTWWAWIGATLYANRFDVDDIGHRLLTAGQMMGVAAMAINVHHGLGESSAGFALAYFTVRSMLVFQYVRAAIYVPQARPLASRYAVGFAIAATLWLLSVFVPAPIRFALWGVGILVDFATPLSALRFQATLLPHTEHLPERFGLFIIIVLGESIIGVVDGVAEQPWSVMSGLSALLGFAIAFSLWWIYFENVGGSVLHLARKTGNLALFQAWFYGHLPLAMGLAATGVAVEHLVLSDPTVGLADSYRWLLCGSVAVCLAALALLHRTGIIFRCQVRSRYRLISAGLLLLLAGLGQALSPLVVMVLVSGISMIQVVQDIYQGHPAANPAME